jgi:hypothetical protein
VCRAARTLAIRVNLVIRDYGTIRKITPPPSGPPRSVLP